MRLPTPLIWRPRAVPSGSRLARGRRLVPRCRRVSLRDKGVDQNLLQFKCVSTSRPSPGRRRVWGRGWSRHNGRTDIADGADITGRADIAGRPTQDQAMRHDTPADRATPCRNARRKRVPPNLRHRGEGRDPRHHRRARRCRPARRGCRLHVDAATVPSTARCVGPGLRRDDVVGGESAERRRKVVPAAPPLPYHRLVPRMGMGSRPSRVHA